MKRLPDLRIEAEPVTLNPVFLDQLALLARASRPSGVARVSRVGSALAATTAVAALTAGGAWAAGGLDCG